MSEALYGGIRLCGRILTLNHWNLTYFALSLKKDLFIRRNFHQLTSISPEQLFNFVEKYDVCECLLGSYFEVDLWKSIDAEKVWYDRILDACSQFSRFFLMATFKSPENAKWRDLLSVYWVEFRVSLQNMFKFVMYYISDNLIFQHFEVLNTTMVQIEIIVKYMTWNPIITNGSN